MKNIFLVLAFSTLLFSCSSDDSSSQTPENPSGDAGPCTDCPTITKTANMFVMVGEIEKLRQELTLTDCKLNETTKVVFVNVEDELFVGQKYCE